MHYDTNNKEAFIGPIYKRDEIKFKGKKGRRQAEYENYIKELKESFS